MNTKSRIRARVLACLLPCVGVFGATANGAVVDFETVGDLSNKFFGAVSGGTVVENYVEGATVGVGSSNSRGIDTVGTSGNYTTLIYKLESFSLAGAGNSVIVSAFAEFRGDTSPTNASSSFLRVGLTDGNNSNDNRITGGAGSAIALDVFPNSGTAGDVTDVNLRYANKVNGAANVFTTAAGGLSALVLGDWYKLTGTFTNVGSNAVSVSGTLENFGPDGTSATPTPVRTIAPSSLTNATLIADTTLYGALLARQDGGSEGVDNFAVVPEPASAGVVGVAAAGLLARRRRRA